MIYEFGSATDQNDILLKIKDFLTANGWSLNYFDLDGVNGGKRLHLNNGDLYLNLRSVIANEHAFEKPFYTYGSGIAMNVSTGYNINDSWSAQPGHIYYSESDQNSVGTFLDDCTQALSYYFWVDGQNFYAAIEYSARRYCWLGCGKLIETNQNVIFCTGTGDYYSYKPSGYEGLNHANYFGSNPFNCFVDSFSERNAWFLYNNKWYSRSNADYDLLPIYGFSNSTQCGEGTSTLIDNSPNSFNALSTLVPLRIWLENNATQGKYLFAGTVPFMRAIGCTHFIEGEIFSLGSDNWRVLPGHSKSMTYGNRGLAILED